MSGRGYSNPGYVSSLSEFGRPVPLPRSGGWLLEREIAGTSTHDLIGPYPLFTCSDWSQLAHDLDELGESHVSAVVVVDPLADPRDEDLARAFPDRRVPMKQHFVRDLGQRATLPAHHRRHVRRASASVEVEICSDPSDQLDDWSRLYAGLVERYPVTGIRAFSREAFRQQLALPGVIAARAERDGTTVGMVLFMEDAPRAYYHLGAYSKQGYEVGASYALFAMVLDHLHERGVVKVDLGGGAGAGANGNGLVRFKRGWANDESIAKLCGRILNRATYEELSTRSGVETDWFPAYRVGDRDLAGDAG